MANDWTDWADGNDLAEMSRSTNPVASAGYDPDDVRANPELRALVMQQAGSPYGLRPSKSPTLLTATGPVTPNVQPIPNAPVRSPEIAPIPNAPVTPPKMVPASASTGKPATAQPASSGLDDVGREALEKGLELGNFAAGNAKTLATADPGTAALEAQEAKDAVPTPYLDPTTGKVAASAEQYKPSGWQKFGRGLESAAIGLVTGGIPGAAVGAIHPEMIGGGTAYNAPNKLYDATEAAREQRLAGDQAQIANVRERFKELTDSRTAANTAAGTAATAFGDVDRGAAGMRPQPVKPGAPQQMMVDGKPTLVNWDPQKGYLSAEPGPTFGQPVQGAVAETPAAGKPQAGLVNGRPGFAISSPQGWLDGRVGPNYGKPLPVGSSFVPTPPASAMGTGLSTPGNPGLHGDGYLATLPAGLAGTVRAIGEGREAPPSASNRSKSAVEILNALNQAYPSYDATQFPTYKAARIKFTSGPIGTAINSFNVALNHLDRMEKNVPTENTRFSTLNTIENELAPSGSKRSIDIGKFRTDANAVSHEVQRAYKGGVVSEDEYNQMIALLNPNAAPKQIQSNLDELRQLLHGKLEGFRQQWASQGPPGITMPIPGINPAENQGGGNGGGGGGSSFDWGSGFHPLPGEKH